MGAYLSEPVTEKVSKDEDSDRLSYGASSMQGWRVSQEDSHNCIIDFDTDTSLFAVYDGHGGSEVAIYCSMNLPDCLRSTADYKKNNLNQALENAFLEFDTSLTKPEVILELKQIAGLPDSDEESVEDASALREEASLPLDEVLARYETTAIKKVAPHVSSDYEKPKSPMLRGKNRTTLADRNGLPGSSKTLTAAETRSAESQPVNGEVDVKDEETSASSTTKDTNKSESSGEDKKEEKAVEGVSKRGKDGSKNDLMQPGCSSTASGRQKRNKKGDYTVTHKSSSDDDESEEEEDDKEYSAKHDSSSEGENEENEGKVKKDGAEDDDEDEDGDDDEEEDDDDDSEEEEEEDESDSSDEESSMGGMGRTNSEEEPGTDSGCTAVVALLRGNKVYVANAGDSRCVVSRNGQAVNLSFDHKPEDKTESERIVKAGGKVTQDGRVNGGLNLSRAIGDHAYKCNEALSAKEQMITAFPDIQTLDIDPKEDQFMVLACDGIWNHMSSQEVVDFVSERIKDNDKKLSSICEELFDHCLAPDTSGDGTGCDNMTAIIVKFRDLTKKQGTKRPAESSDQEQNTPNSKKVKIDDSED